MATLLPLLLIGVIWHHSTISSYGITRCISKDNHIASIPVSIPSRYECILSDTSLSEDPANTHQLEQESGREDKDSEINPEESTPNNLKEILGNYYTGSAFVFQERAFRRVLRWKEDFEDIAGNYRSVDWKKLSAIIKAETQGKTGEQVSSAKAVGMPQIKYQGAWAFVWDAMFRENRKKGSVFVKDYYNANIRARYHSQLKQIELYLQKNNILVYPANSSEAEYRKARSDSWEHLKAHLQRDFKPGEYQVAVDIAAMYIDHLMHTFLMVKKQVEEIKQFVESNGILGLDDIELSGTKMKRWNRIKEYLMRDIEFTDSENYQELTLAHLNNILNRLENRNIYVAAYNLGLNKVLRYIESGRKIPSGIEKYVKTVSTYNMIFHEIEKLRIFS